MTEGGSMTKMDLVCLYIPNASKASVAQWFRREVHANEGLMQALRHAGYRKTLRTLSAGMVDLIARRGEFLEGERGSAPGGAGTARGPTGGP